ncbi:restriction endonuclease subunit S [Bacteroides sp.]|jgi:type I restriction enzyme S subunit|uniref:restriction endonuclease subunit S n=1 Tax=Bacteroides sp. TaxID=29523 RepID=UPI0025C13DAD|nr:restriction endonuclease subunit S [Bacteroides sp.]
MKSNWITATIDDVCTVVTDGAHNSPKSVEQGHYMASVKDFTEFGFDFSNCKQIGEEDYEKLRNQGCVPEKNDILVGKDGARYFEDIIIYKQDERPALLSSIAILRADCRKITPEFLYYTLKSPAVRKDVRDNYGSGSAIPRIVLKDFKRMPFSFPSIEEQRKITNLCSAIDAKIQINNAINENLEQQAKALYQQMFIENTCPDWIEGSLRDIADITMGQSPSGSSYNEDGIGTIFFQGRAEFSFRFPTIRLYTTEPKRMAYANDILMSVRAPVGDLNIAHTDCCIGRGLAAIHSKTNHQSFVLYTMFSLRKQLDVFNGEGTVFGSINRNSLNDMPILIPSDETIEEFEKIVAPMDAAIRNNYDEICRLQAVRDSLLPRLMSGELDVSSLDI